MAYQGSAQSIGFRNRQVIDPSKRMRQEAAQLEQRGKERIQGMEKQASQQIQEMKRVSDIQSSNSQYELQALSKFSNTIKKTLQEDYLEFEKQRKEEGVQRGIELRATNPELAAQENKEVDDALAANQELHNRVEAEAQNAPTAEAKERVRSLSTYERMGWEIGGLKERANGWDAHLEAEFDTNETVITDSQGNSFAIKDYDGLEQYDAALKHLQAEYLKDSNPGNLSSKVVNKYLTDKVLRNSQIHRREEIQGLELESAEEHLDAQENLLHNVLQDGDSKQIGAQFDTWLRTASDNLETIGGKRGTGKKAARLQLRSQIDAVIRANPERAKEIKKALREHKLDHDAGRKSLQELYGDEFSDESIDSLSTKARIDKFRLDQASDTVAATELRDAMLETFRNPSTTESDKMKLIGLFYSKHPDQREMMMGLLESTTPVIASASDSQARINELKSQFNVTDGKDGAQIPRSAVEGLDFKIIAQGIEDGIIAEKPMGKEAIEAVKNANEEIERAVAQVSKENTKFGINTLATGRARTAAQRLVMAKARQLQRFAQEQGTTLSEADAIKKAGQSIAEGIIGVQEKGGKDKFPEYEKFYNKSGQGFTEFEKLSNEGIQKATLQRYKTVTKNALKASTRGDNLLETELGLSAQDLTLTAGGYPRPFIGDLAALQGVTPWEMLNAQRKLQDPTAEPLVPPQEAVLLQQGLDKFPHIKRMLAQGPTPNKIERAQREMGLVSARGMKRALGMQESSNDYGAYNKTAFGAGNPALGKYQILWENVQAWSKSAGYPVPVSQNAFLRNHRLQEQLADWQLNQYIKQAYEQTNDPNIVVRMVSAAWYGGGGSMGEYDNPNIKGPTAVDPDMQKYTTSVLNRYN